MYKFRSLEVLEKRSSRTSGIWEFRNFVGYKSARRLYPGASSAGFFFNLYFFFLHARSVPLCSFSPNFLKNVAYARPKQTTRETPGTKNREEARLECRVPGRLRVRRFLRRWYSPSFLLIDTLYRPAFPDRRRRLCGRSFDTFPNCCFPLSFSFLLSHQWITSNYSHIYRLLRAVIACRVLG